jgi:hypothetical protein
MTVKNFAIKKWDRIKSCSVVEQYLVFWELDLNEVPKSHRHLLRQITYILT